MAKMAINALVVAILRSFVASPAVSRDNDGENDNQQRQNYHAIHDREIGTYSDRRHVSAPEIDPAQALGALALLGGSVAIMRGYRRKK